jgi:hypothetical protein
VREHVFNEPVTNQVSDVSDGESHRGNYPVTVFKSYDPGKLVLRLHSPRIINQFRDSGTAKDYLQIHRRVESNTCVMVIARMNYNEHYILSPIALGWVEEFNMDFWEEI